MSNTKCEYQRTFVAGSSRRATSVELDDGFFDVAIYTSSWDARCVSIVEANQLKSNLGICICFNTRDKEGLRDKHDIVLNNYLRPLKNMVLSI